MCKNKCFDHLLLIVEIVSHVPFNIGVAIRELA